MRIRWIVCAPLWLLVSKWALAEHTLAVVPVEYQVTLEGRASAEGAMRVEAEIRAAAEQCGWTFVRDKTAACKARECLAEVAARARADEAICVAIEQTGVDFAITVFPSRGEPLVAEASGSSSAAFAEVRRLVAQLLRERDEAIAKAAAVLVKDSPPPAPLQPLPFWVGVGLTSALAASFVVCDAVTFARIKKIEDKDGSLNYWQDTRKVQTASRVLLGATAAAAVATGVLALFTNFDEREPANERVTLLPAWQAGPCAVVQGRF